MIRTRGSWIWTYFDHLGERGIRCRHCDQIFSYHRSALRAHALAIREGRKKRCWIWEHYQKLEEGRAKCWRCGRVFQIQCRPHNLKTHAVFCHSVFNAEWKDFKRVELSEYRKCNTCNYLLEVNKNDLKDHLRSHGITPSSEIEQCTQKEQRWLWQYYTALEQLEIKCIKCEETFKWKKYSPAQHRRSCSGMSLSITKENMQEQQQSVISYQSNPVKSQMQSQIPLSAVADDMTNVKNQNEDNTNVERTEKPTTCSMMQFHSAHMSDNSSVGVMDIIGFNFEGGEEKSDESNEPSNYSNSTIIPQQTLELLPYKAVNEDKDSKKENLKELFDLFEGEVDSNGYPNESSSSSNSVMREQSPQSLSDINDFSWQF